MNLVPWARLDWLSRLLAMPMPEPAQQAKRILSVQRNIVLPVRLMVVGVVLYYLYYSHWLDDLNYEVATPREVVLESLQHFFILYLILNAVAAALLILRRFPTRFVQWVVFTVGILDGLLLAGLTVHTGGFGSVLFWVFPGLIVLNSLSIPLATPQLVLNLGLGALYLAAGLLNAQLVDTGDIRSPALPAKQGSPVLTGEDFNQFRTFTEKLRAGNDPVSAYVWGHLSPNLQQELEKPLDSSNDRPLRAALAEDMNTLLRGQTLYDTNRFAGVQLTAETKQLLEQGPTVDRRRLNRLLLEDAFPDYISPNHRLKARKFLKELNPAPLAVEAEAGGSEPYVLRLLILWLLTFSCYGVQLLSFRDRQAMEEAREAASLNSELKAAGRLAAEIAHQLKNPLGIINNAVFSLEKGLRVGRKDFSEQIAIIREEIERSDRIITQLMGYAQLSEGRVEKLDAKEELERAIAEVFPPAANYATQIHKDFAPALPPLMMQRIHLSAVLVNLLQNAREAVHGKGNIHISAQVQTDSSLELIIADDGPGIPGHQVGRIFDPYFTSKTKGTGLGLAIVKHNVELYGGTVNVESKLGKGARFILLFPSRTSAR